MLKSLSVVATLLACTQSADDSHEGHDHDSHEEENVVSLTLLNTYDVVPPAFPNGSNTESCTWDSDLGLFRFIDRAGAMAHITKEGVFTYDVSEPLDAVTAILGNIIIEENSRVYAADPVLPGIRFYDVNSEAWETETITLTTGGSNGLCYDAEHDTMYAGSVGVNFETNMPDQTNAIHKIEGLSTDSPTVSKLNITTLFDENGDLLTENFGLYSSANGPNRQFYPNGCAVKNGFAYFVEVRFDGVGGLGVYDIENDAFSVNTVALTTTGDDIAVYGDILMVSSWGAFGPGDGLMLYWDTEGDETTFQIGLTGLSGPADMGKPSDDGIFCIPSYMAGINEIYFVQMDCGEGDCGIEMDNSGAHGVSVVIALFMAVFASLY